MSEPSHASNIHYTLTPEELLLDSSALYKEMRVATQENDFARAGVLRDRAQQLEKIPS